MASRAEIGAHGEVIAARYLAERGYEIVDRNWRHGRGELDIVASHAGEIVFVEVRARTSDAFGAPEETIGPRKQAALIRTAEAFMVEHGLDDAQWRIDVIAIELDHRLRVNRLEHIESAVQGPP